ncbi:MAG: glycerophosphoryl diester phosphodiesterase membrane domain-containing protein [Verrucomicrobiales bacterium]|nr:glycerophosphoryl diester phosphodiesterase membrane domain-containing protein [Verrucomicrobiales bacterium]
MTLNRSTILKEAWRRFRADWPQLLVADFLARAVAVMILVPGVGFLLRAFLKTTDTGVLADAAILSVLLHPLGWLALVTLSAAWLGIVFFEVGQLVVIASAPAGPARLTWLDALCHTARRFRELVVLGGVVVIRLLVLALPFATAVGLLYLLFLRRYDINYYLSARPPAFLGVALATTLLLVGLGILVASRMASWLLAIPLVLLETRGGREALELSARRTRGHRLRLALWLGAWFAATVLLFTAVGGLTALMADLVIPWANPGGLSLAVSVGGLLALGGLANLMVSVLSTLLLPLCLAGLHRALGGAGGEGIPRHHLPRWLRGRLGPGLAGLFLLLAGLGGYSCLRLLDPVGEPVVIAHRGGAAVAPENTLAAFERAIADGADWLELDVQENADGEVVVVHDRDFMRIGASGLQVADATNEALEQIDAGSSFGARFAGERVPTLRQVLDLARGRVGLFIELKYYGRQQALEPRVVDLVEVADMASDVVLMSLDYAGVRRAAGLRPDWPHGLLNAVAVGDLTKLDVDFLAVNAKSASLALIGRAHARGMKVHAWTINDPVQMFVMISRGLDGLITDRVALARQVIALRRDLGPLGRVLLWVAGESGLLRGSGGFSVAEDA